MSSICIELILFKFDVILFVLIMINIFFDSDKVEKIGSAFFKH
ncbi:hypothetical protein CLU82_2938 [Flavobacterium sp. 5]|nr:hypothetical protein CLU82_2938 [Flavobacterium sp. 5]